MTCGSLSDVTGCIKEGHQGLLVGFGAPARSRVRDALSALEIPVVDAIDAGAARELVAHVRFDSVVAAFPMPDSTLPVLLDAVRRPSSPSRSCALVLVTPGVTMGEAERFLGRGANRVVPLEEIEPRLGEALDRLSRVAPRARVVVPSRLEVRIGGVAKRLFAQTVNLSASGVLLRVPHRLSFGDSLAFELFLAGLARPLCGRARVVRQTLEGREKFPGVALAFTELVGGDGDRLTAHLERLAGTPTRAPALPFATP